MTIKSMLMSLLTVMLLGIILSSKSVHVALNKSIHWLPIILRKGAGPRSGLLQMWLGVTFPGKHTWTPTSTCTPYLRERGSTSPGDSKLPVHTPVRLLVIAYYNCLLTCLLWQTTASNTGTFFFISVFQSYIIVLSRYMWNILNKCGISAYCVWNIHPLI